MCTPLAARGDVGVMSLPAVLSAQMGQVVTLCLNLSSHGYQSSCVSSLGQLLVPLWFVELGIIVDSLRTSLVS